METVNKYVALSWFWIDCLIDRFIFLDLSKCRYRICKLEEISHSVLVLFTVVNDQCSRTYLLYTLLCKLYNTLPLKAVKVLPENCSEHLMQMSISTGVCVWTLRAWMKKVKITCPFTYYWLAVQRVKFVQSSNSPSSMLKEKKQKQWVCVALICLGHLLVFYVCSC